MQWQVALNDTVNHHLPPTHHKQKKSKRVTLTSHVSWSIGFEMWLTDSLAHHFFGYVYFCIHAYKPFNAPTKKTIKRIQIAKKIGHIGFWMFWPYALKLENLSMWPFFCTFKSLEEAWSWWQVWQCVCVFVLVCARITMPMGLRGLLFGRQFETPCPGFSITNFYN